MKKSFLAAAALICGMGLPVLAQAKTSWELTLQNVYNNNERVVLQYWTDENGERQQPDDKSYAQIRYTWNGRDRLTLTEHLNLEGKPAKGDHEWATKRQTYTGGGKTYLLEYTDAEGNLVLGPEGFARQQNAYEGSRLLETWNYGAEGEPLRSDRLYAHYKTTNKAVPGKTKKTRTWYEAYYDADGNLMDNEDGFAQVESEYYHDTYLQSRAYKDAEGNYVFNARTGYAIMRKEFDRNFVSAVHYYDEQENEIALLQENASEAPHYAKQNADEAGMEMW